VTATQTPAEPVGLDVEIVPHDLAEAVQMLLRLAHESRCAHHR